MLACACPSHAHQTVLVAQSPLGTNGNGSSTAIAISDDGQKVLISTGAEDLTTPTSENHVLLRDFAQSTTTNLSTNLTFGFPNYYFGYDVFNNFTGIDDRIGYGSFSQDSTVCSFTGFRQGFRPAHRMTTFLYNGQFGFAGPLIDEVSWNTDSPYASFAPMSDDDGESFAIYSHRPDLVPLDTNNACDVFVKSLLNGQIIRASVDNNGLELPTGTQPEDHFVGYPYASRDLRYVVFSTTSNADGHDSNGLSDVYVRDTVQGITARLSGNSLLLADGPSKYPCISGDGKTAVFQSWATNLIPGTPPGSFYAVNLEDFTIKALKNPFNGKYLTGRFPTLSQDGKVFAFESTENDLVPGDGAGSDIFAYRMTDGALTRVSVGPQGEDGILEDVFLNLPPPFCLKPRLSGDGEYISYSAPYKNLAPGDTNGGFDAFRTKIEFPDYEVPKVETSNPVQALVGSADLEVILTGENYFGFTKFFVNGVERAVSYVAPSEVRIQLLAAELAAEGNLSITASNPVPGIGPSSPYVFKVVIPQGPDLDDVQPRDVPVGSEGFLITLTGEHFIPGSVVCFADESVTPESITETTIICRVPNHIAAQDQFVGIRVRDPYGQQTGDFIVRIGQPAGLVFSGTIVLEQYQMSGGEIVSLQVFSGETMLVERHVTLNAEGAFETLLGPDVFPGSYTIRAKGSHWLAKKVANIEVARTGGQLGSLSLTNGDCDGDNAVGTDDYLILSNAFDLNPEDPTYDARADLNGDGSVSSDDYLIINQNFDTEGD